MKNKQQGFTLVEGLLILFVLAVIGGVGYYVWSKQDSKISDNSANQQAADTSETDEEAAEPADETDSWLSYTSVQKTYTVRIPDGWDMIHLIDTENLYGGRSQEGLVYKPGQQAKVETTYGGWDGPSPFALYVPGANHDQIVKEGDKQGEIKAASGQQAEKYYFVEADELEEIGYIKGAKVYNYYFGSDGKYIQIQHVVNPGNTDQHERVEQMLKTLVVN